MTSPALPAVVGGQAPGRPPIPCRGRQLVTLEDTAAYIMKLPKAQQDIAEWQAATEALIVVAENGGPRMFAGIGVPKA
jgi:hypothetical protein